MRHNTQRAARLAACAALVAGGALSTSNPVTAQDAPPPDPVVDLTGSTAPFAVTLPLLGAPVLVAVTTDASGVLLDVSLSPSDTIADNAIHLTHVSFVNVQGTVELKVAGEAAADGADRPVAASEQVHCTPTASAVQRGGTATTGGSRRADGGDHDRRDPSRPRGDRADVTLGSRARDDSGDDGDWGIDGGCG